MATSKYFSPNENLKPEETLYEFINMAKNELEIFGKDLPFNDNIWDITDTIPGKQNTKHRIYFSNLEDSKKRKKKDEIIIPMREPFLSFSKAYLRYKQGMSPITTFIPLLTSMRLLEYALIDMTQKSNPADVNTDVLNRAIEIGKKHFTLNVLYRHGGQLEKIAKFLSDKRISKISIDWKKPIKKPSNESVIDRVGKDADDARNNKMPSQRALDVLPNIFFNATDSKDKLITSMVAVLLGAPDRIGELLLLQEYCEVVQKDSNGNEQYGLSWYPEKGGNPMVKWIIPSMADTVKKAIERIRELTEPAREVARWYELNPNKIYLPVELEYLRSKRVINLEEAALVLYGEPSKNSLTSVLKRTYKVDYEIIIKKAGSYKKAPKKETVLFFKDLERAVLSQLPKDFPYINKAKGFKYSETLLIQRSNEYVEDKATQIPSLKGFRIGFFSDALGARDGHVQSIFEKFGYREIDGSPLKVKSHEFRHYLNTLAKKGGASELDIAKWSGRKEVSQNVAYDHVTANEMLQIIHESIGNEELMLGALSNIEGIKKKVVISRDEYAQLKVKTAHKTDFGVCIHDFSMMPCQLHMDCINCTEQVCIKGDKNSNQKIRERKLEVEEALRIAQTAQEEGHFGASRWIKHQTLELQKLTELCDIFDNGNVPDGALIHISNTSAVSQIEQSQIRHQEAIEEPPIEMEEMANLLEDLGGDLI